MNRDFLIKQIDSHQYISFDIFDTLIKRNLKKPTDIFELSNLILKNRTQEDVEGFKQLRIEAENRARKYSQNEEVTLEDIYSHIKNIDNDLKKKIYNIELELEYKFCQANQEIKFLYDYCIEKKKNIIIISDMYLSEEFIEKILNKCGFNKYSKLYVSSTYNKTKYIGSLYNYVLKDNCIKPYEMFHIGDNFKSDFIKAKSKGIKAYLYKKKNLNYDKKIKYNSKNEELIANVIDTFICNNYPEEESDEFKFGYEKIGPLVAGFTYWLKHNLESKGIEKIYFLSREGLFLKKSLECCFPEVLDNIHYLYVSRRSLQVPFLKDIKSFNDILSILEFRKKVSIEVFLKKCGLDYDIIKSWCNDKEYNLETRLEDIESPELVFENLIQNIKQNSKKEFDLLIQYLKQEKFYGKVAIVDIGWKGTMQDLLIKNLRNGKIDAQIQAFYMGLLNSKRNLSCENKYGFLQDVDNVLFTGMTLFETMFSANHGSVKKYTVKEDVIVPVLCDFEYTKEDLLKLAKIQDGIMYYLKTYKKQNINFDELINSSIAFTKFSKTLVNPTLKEVKLLGEISYFDTQKSTLANIRYTINLKNILRDFLLSGWKVGYLKGFFKINMPYMKIYKILKEKF